MFINHRRRETHLTKSEKEESTWFFASLSSDWLCIKISAASSCSINTPNINISDRRDSCLLDLRVLTEQNTQSQRLSIEMNKINPHLSYKVQLIVKNLLDFLRENRLWLFKFSQCFLLSANKSQIQRVKV